MTEATLEKTVESGCFPFSSPGLSCFSTGRYALIAALRLIDPSRRGTLLLPSYICRSVTGTLDHHGCAYGYYPITRMALPDFDAIPSLLAGDVTALLFVNYFGFPHPVKPLVDLCRRRGIVLIEDNAHGFLGRDEDGTPLGARGDVGIFSFPKTIYVPDGGGMVVNHPELADRSEPRARPAMDPGFRGAFRMKRQVLRTIESLGIDSRMVGRLRRGGDGAAESAAGEDRGMSEVTAHLLEKVDPEAAAEYRRRSYRQVVRICGELGLEPLTPDPGRSVCPYLVPIVSGRSGRRERVETELRRRGWRVSHWPDLPSTLDRGRYPDAWWLRENITAVYLRPAVV